MFPLWPCLAIAEVLSAGTSGSGCLLLAAELLSEFQVVVSYPISTISKYQTIKGDIGRTIISLVTEKSKSTVSFGMFFPTCQVRVVRFYVSLLFSFSSFSSSSLSSPPSSSSSINWDPLSSVWRAGPQWQLGSSEFSVACWTSTAIL